MTMQTNLTQWSGGSLPLQVCNFLVDIVGGLVLDFMLGLAVFFILGSLIINN
jgi:hypothetical protein